ncbi:class I SAM-dependent methyltransferase [Oscillatoria acuminata]|uniref:Methylase involved in ubiquinone/menaquinone biosynthesis n=1 Tax=Oscillatoria acuminata PCC 6304 TaxID=56110 RepID=K9TG89_9CYAN|nr:class I SAM-dependent methyltransferase [Oscillatoria acuminata]AFY81403.1 methylase involved in ubiquinone/menaquinone biosynthesis [Oscillatoria acuminata PCC 6304]
MFGVINASPRNLLVQSIIQKNLHKLANESYIKGKLVDIGCGTKPYKDLLSPYVTDHIGVDHENTIHNKSEIDLIGTAYNIPIENAIFDSAICTAVLEHLEEPELALKECYRVLKPGGLAIYSVPFIWHIHEEPRDFYRFSKYGLKYLFEKVGFEIVEIKALSGFWVTFGQLFVYNLYRLNRGPLRWFRIIDAVGLCIQLLSYGLNKIDKTEQWTWMYMIVALKK